MGIDPGKGGAVCIIYPDKLVAYKCPKTAHEMSDIIREYLNTCNTESYEAMVCIEKVHVFPTDGKVSAFTFGTNYGMWQGILGCFHIEAEFIRPQEWQSIYKEDYDIPKEYVKKKRKFKEIASNYMVNVTLATADAILIARYLKEKHDGKTTLEN
jgi:hypothetical protein